MNCFTKTIARPRFINTTYKYTQCYSLSSKSTSIPAEPVLLCKNCVHLELREPDFYVSSEMKQTALYKKYIFEYAKCLKFGKIDLVTGEIKYDYASFARLDSTKCGYKALFYEEKEQKVNKTYKNSNQYRNKKYDESPLS